jgi:peptide chain release factor subunit 3
MIQGASQADIGVLVISARKGEFETGFERGGQTREHTMLAKTCGINKMVVAVNKMDDPTVEWDKSRFDKIVAKLSPFLRQTGYHPKNDICFIPVSGFTGVNIQEHRTDICPWYSGPALLEYLDDFKTTNRKFNVPWVIPISDKWNVNIEHIQPPL